jgi:hypothetical protein
MRTPECEQDLVFLIGDNWNKIKQKTDLQSIKFVDQSLDAVGKYDGQEVMIEVETESGNFFRHGHDEDRCDVVICWSHGRNYPRIVEESDDEFVEKVEKREGYGKMVPQFVVEAGKRGYDPFDRLDIKVIELSRIIEE